MALLTKLIGIVTPLILSIVVVVAPRLISYKKELKIVSYMGLTRDHIVHGLRCEGVRKETMQSNVSAYE